MAREVLDVQAYPDLRQYPGGPPERPYDAAGWSLPLQMGVRVVAAAAPLTDEMRAKMTVVGALPEPKVKPTPYEAALQTDAAPFDSLPGVGFNTDPAAAAIVPPPAASPASGSGAGPGSGAEQHVQGDQPRVEAGRDRPGERRRVGRADSLRAARPVRRRAGRARAVAVAAGRARPTSAPGRAVRQPRIGLYQPWTGSMDEGWTRWVLEQYGFSFDRRSSGGLQVAARAEDRRADHRRRCARAGGGRGRPAAADAVARRPAVRPEYAYQLTAGDLQGFEQFVRGGGTLVCLSNASTFAIQQFKLPVRNVVAGLRPEEFFLRGSIVEVTTDPTHPVMAGMPEKAAVFVDGSPVFETQDGFKGTVLARYQESGSPLLSGYLIGEKYLQGKAAALDVQLDAGHVVLLGFRPEWRGQPFGTFRVLFNAALFSR